MRDFFYCLIFPHSSNNHRAKFLQTKAILFFISFFLFSSLIFSSPLNPVSEKIKAFADVSIQELYTFTNQKRAESGLPALSQNPLLSEAARKKADDMFAKNYWAHNSPDGTTPWFFIKESGYNYIYAGENLARGFTDSQDVMNAWMSSKLGHRENILSPNFKDVGFAVKSGVLNGEQTFLVVQEFGSRAVSPIAQVRKKAPPVPKAKRVLGFDAPAFATPSISRSGDFAILLLLSFIAILAVDAIIIKRRKVVRFVGHNSDHAIFLGAMVLILIMLGNGAII